jgi:hypothetical protein
MKSSPYSKIRNDPGPLILISVIQLATPLQALPREQRQWGVNSNANRCDVPRWMAFQTIYGCILGLAESAKPRTNSRCANGHQSYLDCHEPHPVDEDVRGIQSMVLTGPHCPAQGLAPSVEVLLFIPSHSGLGSMCSLSKAFCLTESVDMLLAFQHHLQEMRVSHKYG